MWELIVNVVAAPILWACLDHPVATSSATIALTAVAIWGEV
jgi:hypothetical protein